MRQSVTSNLQTREKYLLITYFRLIDTLYFYIDHNLCVRNKFANCNKGAGLCAKENTQHHCDLQGFCFGSF